MWRSVAIAFLSFPATALAFVLGWALADLRAGLFAGAAVFSLFFLAAGFSLLLMREYSYADAALPPVFAGLWSLALAPFSLGASLFSAPAFIGAGLLLGACMALAKRYRAGFGWLLLPALVFVYEMLPVNIPGPVDDAFALAGGGLAVLKLLAANVLPRALKERGARRRKP